MKSKMLIICSTVALLHIAVAGVVVLGGCITTEEEDPMPPDAKIIPQPAPDSTAVKTTSPSLTPAQPKLDTISPDDPLVFKPAAPEKGAKQVKKADKKAVPVVRKGVTTEQTYVVKNGDSYWKIAKSFGISWKELQSANKNAKLYPGKKITIPAGASKSAVKATSKKVSAKNAKTAKKTAKAAGPVTASGDVYVVKSGDSFSRIAKRYGVRASDIAALNGIPLTRMLQVGQKLKIPAKGTKKTAVKANTAKNTKTAAKQEAKTPEKIDPKPTDTTDVNEPPAVPDATPALPGKDEKAPAAPAVPAAPAATEPAAPAAPAAPEAAKTAAWGDVKVEKDSSFEELAKNYTCTVAELKQLNPQITGNIVPKGTSIKLP